MGSVEELASSGATQTSVLHSQWNKSNQIKSEPEAAIAKRQRHEIFMDCLLPLVAEAPVTLSERKVLGCSRPLLRV